MSEPFLIARMIFVGQHFTKMLPTLTILFLLPLDVTLAVDGRQESVVTVPLKFGEDEFTDIEAEYDGSIYGINVPSLPTSNNGTAVGVLTVYEFPTDTSQAVVGGADMQKPVQFFSRVIGFEIIRGGVQVDAIFEWDPLVLTFSGLQNRDEDDPVCLHRASRNEGLWRTDGCRVSSIYLDKVTCDCKRPGQFSIALQSQPDNGVTQHSAFPWQHTLAAPLITFCVLIQAALFYRCIRPRIAGHMNISLSLLALFATYFCSNIQEQSGFTTASVLLNYFLQATFTWLLLEGALILMKSQDDPSDLLNIHMAACLLVGWGCPAIFVLISVAYNCHNLPGMQSPGSSFDNSLIWSLYSPSTYVGIMKSLFVIHFLRDFMTGSQTNSATHRMHSGCRMLVAIEFPLITTWCVCLFLTYAPFVIVSHALVSVNSVQGLFVFFPKCLKLKEKDAQCQSMTRRISCECVAPSTDSKDENK